MDKLINIGTITMTAILVLGFLRFLLIPAASLTIVPFLLLLVVVVVTFSLKY